MWTTRSSAPPAAFAALLAAMLVPAAPAAPLSPDPVEVFRLALLQERPLTPTPESLQIRRQKLEEAARNLRSLGDMSRALLLLEWRSGQLRPQEADIDRQIRQMVIENFERGLRAIMRSGDVQQRIAAANLIGETVSGARRQDIETVETELLLRPSPDKRTGPAGFRYLRDRMKKMAGDLDNLANDPSPEVRISAARALGNIEGDPKEVAPALQRLIRAAEPTVRQAAAAAILNALQVVIQLSNERISLQNPLEDLPEEPTDVDLARARYRGEPLRSITQFVPVASGSLEDSDPAVRRLCVEACRKSSAALVTLLTLTSLLKREDEMPPKGFPLTSEEQAMVLNQRAIVYAILESVTPVLREFRNEAPAWARVATDSDPTVRIEVRHIFEDLALAIQRINHLEQSVNYPGLPPRSEEKKPNDKKPEPSKIGRTGGAALEWQLPPGGLPDATQTASLGAPIKVASHELPSSPEPVGPVPVGPLPAGPEPEPDAVLGAPAATALPATQLPKPEDLPPPAKLKGSNIPLPLETALDLARGALIAGLSDPDPKVRLASLDALETMGNAAAPAVPALVGSLRDSDRFVRWAASRTLGKLAPRGANEAVPALDRLLNPEEDLSVRLSAANSLAKYGATAGAAVGALGRALQAKDSEVRLAALKTLEAVGTDATPALPGIAWRLKDPNPSVRAEAARVLSRFGSLASGDLPALRKALFDPVEDVRRAASDAILAIDVKQK